MRGTSLIANFLQLAKVLYYSNILHFIPYIYGIWNMTGLTKWWWMTFVQNCLSKKGVYKNYINVAGVRTFHTFATLYPGLFILFQGTKWRSDFGHFVPWTLIPSLQDTSYLLTRHFLPSYFIWISASLMTILCFVTGWLWSKSKSNQLLLFCWDQGAILTIAWLFAFKISVKDMGGRCCLWR